MIPIALGVVVLLVWSVILALKYGRHQDNAGRAGANEQVLTEFVVRSLDLHAFGDVLADATLTAQTAFGAARGVIFEPGAREGTWDAWAPGPQPLEPVLDTARPVFAWLKHNAEVISLDEVSGPRFGAMRIPLSDLKARYGIDTLVPLVDRRTTIGAIGLLLGRRPSAFERSLLEHLRIEATAAAANLRLHREAAHKLTLEKEVDLASAVQRALLPAVQEASAHGLSWVGHCQFSGQAGSDFWCSYEVGGGKTLIVIGDVKGSGQGIADSMVSAVAKSCCDAFHAAGTTDPGALLTALNRALWRPQRLIHMTAVAALFDAARGQVAWANAGHTMPYFAAAHDQRLGVLTGSGPMLGDVADARYASSTRGLARGDGVLLYTDGLVEAMNLSRVPFGERRLQRALSAAKTASPPRVRDAIVKAVDDFRSGAPIDDDELLVYVRVG